MPNIQVSAPGRQILQSGTLALDADQRAVRFMLDDLPLDLVFEDGGGEANVRSESVGNGAQLHLRGFNNPLGTAYTMPSLATVDEMTISMVIIVHAIAVPGTSEPPVRLLSYSVYATERAL